MLDGTQNTQLTPNFYVRSLKMFNFLIIPISQNSEIFYWHKKNYFPITDSYIRTQLLYDIYLFCSKMNTFPNVIHRFLSKLNPFRFHSERREKTDINFDFPTSLWCLKRKAFIKTFEAPQRSVKIII